LRGQPVVFAEAELDEHPTDWPRKDDLAHEPGASRLLRHAISASLFRPVVGVVVRHDERVLLVKPSRGVAEGVWTLPGGFVNAFEQPAEAAKREVREETGIQLDTVNLETTVTYSHANQPYPILGLGFTAQSPTEKTTPAEDEIAEARWVDPASAHDEAYGLARQVIDALQERQP